MVVVVVVQAALLGSPNLVSAQVVARVGAVASQRCAGSGESVQW